MSRSQPSSPKHSNSSAARLESTAGAAATQSSATSSTSTLLQHMKNLSAPLNVFSAKSAEPAAGMILATPATAIVSGDVVVLCVDESKRQLAARRQMVHEYKLLTQPL